MVDTENKYFHTHLTINRSGSSDQNISQLFWLKTANQKLISTIVTLNNSSHALNKHKLQADVTQIYKYTKTEKKTKQARRECHCEGGSSTLSSVGCQVFGSVQLPNSSSHTGTRDARPSSSISVTCMGTAACSACKSKFDTWLLSSSSASSESIFESVLAS
jgi:hypothetical protein